MGPSSAIHLEERRYQVCVGEDSQIYHGSLGRNDGQFIFGFSTEMPTVPKMIGRFEEKKIWELSLKEI
jgi:hypothetical protein